MDRDALFDEFARSLHARLLAAPPADDAAAAMAALVETEAGCLSQEERSGLLARVQRLAFGMGPLDALLADPGVEEIMCHGRGEIWVDRGAGARRAGASFESEAALRHAIDRILAPLGRRVDELSPLADARLPDGSRVHAALPPLAVDGPALTIRRFRPGGMTAAELVATGTWPQWLADWLAAAVAGRRTVLVSGGTASGKTTLLGALSAAIPAGERIVTIEDAAELSLQRPHVVRLEARPAGIDGRGEVTIRDLVRAALRMRPDRIVVGEARGGEALDMIAAMTTGHDGSLATIHASSPEGALRRLVSLALMGGAGLPHGAVAEQAAAAVDLVVHLDRTQEGRRVSAVAEVLHQHGGPRVRPLYRAGGGGRARWRAPLSPGLRSLHR